MVVFLVVLVIISLCKAIVYINFFENQEKAQNAYDDYQIEIYSEVIKFPWESFKDPLIRRQFRMLDNLDEAALPAVDRSRVSTWRNVNS